MDVAVDSQAGLRFAGAHGQEDPTIHEGAEEETYVLPKIVLGVAEGEELTVLPQTAHHLSLITEGKFKLNEPGRCVCLWELRIASFLLQEPHGERMTDCHLLDEFVLDLVE